MYGVNDGGYGAIFKQYSTVGNSGMTKAEYREYGRQVSQEAGNQVKAAKTWENAAEIQNAAQMYGLGNIDVSIFDTNGDGFISTKEKNMAMNQMSRMAQMGSMGGAQSSGGSSNVYGMLNSLGGAVADLAGGEQGGGGFLDKAGKILGGLFG